MQYHPLQKKQWIKLGLFCIACILVVNGVLFNQIELALLALLAMAFSFWNLKEISLSEGKTTSLNKQEISPSLLFLTIALWIAAVSSEMGAVYFSSKTQAGTLSLILWLASIVLIMWTGIVFDKLNPFAALKQIKDLSLKAHKHLFIEIAMVAAVTAIALLLRVVSLNHYPVTMHGDEGEMGLEALRVLGIGDPINPLGVGWGLFPNLYYYMLAGSIHIFGRNVIGLRMLSALFGTFCVPLVYLIGRKFWGKLAGFTAAWLIAVSHFNIHYSRSGLNNIESTFFMILFILLSLTPYSFDLDPVTQKNISSNFLNGKFKITPYIAIGIVCGLAQYMYVGSRLILLVAFPLYIFLFLQKRINLTQICVMVFSAALVFAPLGLLYLEVPDAFTARIQTVFTFNSADVYYQLEHNLNFYLQSGDASMFSPKGIPGLDFITAILFWLGFGTVFSRPYRIPEMALMVWFVFGIIFGGILTDKSPYGPRLLMSTAAVFIMAGVFIQRTWDTLNEFFSKISNNYKTHIQVFAPILASLLIVSLGINMNYYFEVYPKSQVNIIPISIEKQIILSSPADHVYLLGDGEIYVGHGVIRFLAGDGKAMDLKNIEDLPALTKDGKGITVLATASHFNEMDGLQSIYPQGIISDQSFMGQVILRKYQIPPLPLQ